MGAGHLSKCIVTKIKPSAVEAGPRDPILRKPFSEAVGFESAPLIDAIVRIYVGDELILNV